MQLVKEIVPASKPESNEIMIRRKWHREYREVRGYTLLRNVRGLGLRSPTPTLAPVIQAYGGITPQTPEQDRASCTTL